MRILITGANGFIGRHIAKYLLNQNEVFGVIRTESSINNSFGVKWIYADLSEPCFVNQLPSGIDCVIHLAQSTQYRKFPEGAHDMLRINVDSTCHLLDWARLTGVKQFIFTSTANVYGRSNEPVTEAHPTQPESFYGASNLAAEYLAKQYKNYFQVDILRLFTVYGPKQNGMLIPNLVDQIIARQPINLDEVYLSPIYVEDLVVVINKLIGSSTIGMYRLFNVCGDEILSLTDIVKGLETILSIKANIELTYEKVNFFVGKNDLIKNFLGPGNMTNLNEGLAKTFRKRLS